MRLELKLDIIVVAHQSRTRMAEKLAEGVEATEIIWDRGKGARDTHERAWRELDDITGRNPGHWGMVIEDDARPCFEFRRCMIASLQSAPHRVVSAYLGRGRPPQYQDPIARVMATPGADWLTANAVLHGVGIAIRGDQIYDMVRAVCHLRTDNGRRRKLGLPKDLPMDEAQDAWVKDRGLAVAYQHPSLLNHDPAIPSIIGSDRTRTHAVKVDAVRAADMTDLRAWWFGHKVRWNSVTVPIPEPTS